MVYPQLTHFTQEHSRYIRRTNFVTQRFTYFYRLVSMKTWKHADLHITRCVPPFAKTWLPQYMYSIYTVYLTDSEVRITEVILISGFGVFHDILCVYVKWCTTNFDYSVILVHCQGLTILDTSPSVLHTLCSFCGLDIFNCFLRQNQIVCRSNSYVCSEHVKFWEITIHLLQNM